MNTRAVLMENDGVDLKSTTSDCSYTLVYMHEFCLGDGSKTVAQKRLCLYFKFVRLKFLSEIKYTVLGEKKSPFLTLCSPTLFSGW